MRGIPDDDDMYINSLPPPSDLTIPDSSLIPALSNQKHRRNPLSSDFVPHLLSRQDWGSEFPPCDNVGNDVLSCWPTEKTSLVQGQFSRFIWNARFAPFIGSVDVDIYLFHADSDIRVNKWTEHNAKGWIPLEVDDSWFGSRGYDWQPGQNQTLPFYFLIVKAKTELTGGEPRQPTFFAIQTGPLQAVLSASSASAIAASSSASMISASSVSMAASTNTANLQSSNNNASNFPPWAIALLTILGVLSLIALLLLSYFVLRKLRTDRKITRQLHRSSVGSDSPMMAAVVQHTSPGAGDPVPTSYSGPPMPTSSVRYPQPQFPIHDGASTTSRANSAGEGLISGADAAIMADAFRKALRKPDFAEGPVEEGENNGQQAEEQLINRELAEEGRDLRTVSSERGVRVETLPND